MSGSTTGNGVNVTIETSTENQIIEVGYDGQEIVQPPLTLTEHLAKQAGKINFGELIDEDDDDAAAAGGGGQDADQTTDDDDDDGESGSSDDDAANGAEGGSGWAWESTRNKLRDALTELSVLSDVIAVATKECGKDPGSGQPKRYMVLDGPVQAEPPESKPLVTYLAKKKSLDAPARILLQGAENLGQLLQQQQLMADAAGKDGGGGGQTAAGSGSKKDKTTSSTAEDFHLELLKLRQNWRLKKVSHTILGDLSYRTAGSQFKQSGIFEVVKADASSNVGGDDADGASGDSPVNGAASSTTATPSSTSSGAPRSSLKVNVPSDLEGVAFIQVIIQKEQDLLTATQLTNPNAGGGGGSGSSQSGVNLGGAGGGGGAVDKDMFWQTKLEAAQNVLFCKELFSQLAKEAIQLQAPIPHMVVGNQITASLFPDIQLLITLCHSTPSAAAKANGGEQEKQSQVAQQSQLEHSHVLEHSLYQLLRMQHHKNINPDHAGLSTAPVGISKRRRLAGPGAASRKDLLEMAASESLLEQMIRQAQHVVLRLRTAYVLDTLARDLKDPLISCHWGTISSPTRTSVKVCITTAGYDAIMKTQLVIHVGEKKMTVICKDGRVLHFSHEPQELRDFILCQIAQHQINGVQALAKCTGWQMLSSSTYHLGSGVVEPLGNAVGCLMASPGAGDKFIAVRHGSQTFSAVSVYVSSAPCKDFFAGSLVSDGRKWENLPESFSELRLDKMDGKNLLNKLELLMSALST